MGQDFFIYLPSEIILNILSRLHSRTIMSCKCVCKPWLNLLETPEFVKSHLSKSVPGLAVFEWKTLLKPFKIVEFLEEVDLNCDELHWNVVCNFNLPFHEPVLISANGLLFLHKGGYFPGDIFLCNPITRDYIKIPSPPQPSSEPVFLYETHGFGVSRMSGQYKVVRIFIARQRKTSLAELECQVYTVGTGSWRGIASGGTMRYEENTVGAFLNGNLHWFAREGSSRQISCLDLETELFSTFSPPPPLPFDNTNTSRNLSVLCDCLCVCHSWGSVVFSDDKIDIWLMKAYGDQKSWSKQFSIRNVDMSNYLGYLCPIKVFKDGDIMMELIVGLGFKKLLYYSSKTKTIQEADDVFGLGSSIIHSSTTFAPSFLSLKFFAMENVTSF